MQRRFHLLKGFAALAVVCFLCSSWRTTAAGGQLPGRRAETVQADILLLFQGDPVLVKASPALCGNPRPQSAELLKQWYFSDTGCNLLYPPQVSAVVSSFSEGGAKRIAESGQLRSRLTALLDELRQSVENRPLPLQEKLMIHSTAWEITFGLRQSLSFHPEWKESVDPIVARSLGILQKTSFSADEAARLPDNLARLPRAANVPEIESLVLSLLQHEPGFVEVVPPTDLHADALLGRFTPRIFLTAATASQQEQFRRLVVDSATTQEKLLNLPQELGDVRAVLVLYFNVFLKDGRILPTKEVAFWLEYSFSGKAGFDLPFDQAADRIRFRAIEYQKRADTNLAEGKSTGPGSLYKLVDQAGMARQSFLNVKPQVPGMDVTSVRGSCLGCHLNQIATFDTHGRRRFEVTEPFAKKGRETLTPFYQKYESQLREMLQHDLGKDSARSRN